MTLGLDYVLPFGDASPLVAIFAVCVPIRMAASFVNLKSTAEIVQSMTMSRLREGKDHDNEISLQIVFLN